MLAKTIAAITAALLGVTLAATPAQARTRATCDTQIAQVTVGGVKKTRLWVTGKPFSTGPVYTFRLTWGWTNTVSTYRSRYQAYNAPRHTPLTKAESWVGTTYKCNTWFAGQLF